MIMSQWNGVGTRTLFVKEVRRFSKVWMQTVFGPLVTTSLYFLVFGLALGAQLRTVQGVPYVQFVAPGLVMLALLNNAFLNTSSSLFQSKINGTLTDLLVAPLGPAEILLAYVGAGVVRGVLVGLLVLGVALFFTGFHVHHWVWTIGFGLAVAVLFSLAGLAVAIWAEKFDHLALIPNFVLTPLTFVGGVFYSVDLLPEPWRTLSHLNPILYMVDGFRWGLLGITDVPMLHAALVVGALIVLFGALVSVMLTRGYKLRR